MATEETVNSQSDDGDAPDSLAKVSPNGLPDGPPDGIVDFVTLGMFIIDDIEYLPPRPPVRDILGGAGSYAALGARLFSPPPQLSRGVGWIVDQGSDFPPAISDLVSSWQTAVVMRHDPKRLTTRGWNGYDAAERRAFRYLTPKLRITAEDLPPSLLTARSFHIISSASRCRELVADILARRRQVIEALGEDSDSAVALLPRPYFIWEPVPDLCTPDELLECTNTLPVVDVCSPNHSELAGYMGDPDAGLDPETGKLSKAAVERACEQLLSAMPVQSYALVVRAAEHGCYIAKTGARHLRAAKKTNPKRKPKRRGFNQDLHGSLRPDTDIEALFADLLQDEEGFIAREETEVDPGLEVWVPAVSGDNATSADGGDFEEGGDKPKVVDPTGGGNAFLGGFSVAVARGKSLDEAAVWGNVAASFAIEQVGVPVRGQDADGRETWNGVRVDDRCAAYEARLRKTGLLRG
ncbi:carbohydrate/purine kinase [Niveomyces insectorum RCEF 264]|uniref:Carbohydrate/purine kinase n=1 Tax=Niveomyces insectorum RCEF 264 TaxID=1081102 RepID=A0A168ABT3_9HYPO|nr:carbohydrate/purine kinase [Niveomyces insectorum RCEF 264]